jgi:cation diffusion facilitator family transporter
LIKRGAENSTLKVRAVEHSARLKRRVAISSILASVFLTLLKLIIGMLTNSLGIISEAMHSGVDVIAACTTLYAVIVASRPPDKEHPYGHAKFESLASLIEIILLFAVAGWVFFEGVDRLLVTESSVEITPISISIMFVSIVVDFGRSRSLLRASKEHVSQALEADGLHFRADMITSAIILVGLFAVYLFSSGNADAYAAIIASILMVYTSLGLGRRTLDVLLDRAPLELYEIIEQRVSNLEGIQRVKDLRVRLVGPQSFVDMHIEVPRTFSHDRAHSLATRVEASVKEAVPNSDVLVHVDAVEAIRETIADKVRFIAADRKSVV